MMFLSLLKRPIASIGFNHHLRLYSKTNHKLTFIFMRKPTQPNLINQRFNQRFSPLIFFSLCLTLLFAFTMPSQAQTHPIPNFASAYTPAAYKAKEKHGAVELRVIGQDEHRALIFVPAQPLLKGDAPVIFFHHGWQGMNPMNFGALIDHLVRSGHVVIYPTYQKDGRTDPRSVTKNAGHANRLALNQLAKEFGISPQQGRTLYYGFSIGAAISINLMLQHNEYGLPPADALFLVAPGDAYHTDYGQHLESIYGTFEKIPAHLPIVIMAGEEDQIALPTAESIFTKLCRPSAKNRVLYTLPSSAYTGTKVTAGHGSPGAPDSRYNFDITRQQFPAVIEGVSHYEASASLNQLDFHGYWKMLDALLEGLKTKQMPSIVFGSGSPEQLYLGHWPDGSPLTPMKLKTPSN